jgi:Ca2+-binding RTX toxin-like protein
VLTTAQLAALSATQLEGFTAVQVQSFNEKALAYLGSKGYTLVANTTLNSGLEVTTTVDNEGTNLASAAVNSASLIIAGAKAVNITGGTAADTIFGSTLNDTINGGGGIDSITAGAGNDTITFKQIGDTIDGGAGKDTLAITTAYTSVGDSDENLSAVETVRATATTASTLSVDLSAQTEGFVINTVYASGTGLVSIIGSAGADSITGLVVADTLRGSDGNDTISGGTSGADVLTGGEGDDTFSFTLGANSTNIVTITDFGLGVDKFAGTLTSTGQLTVTISDSSSTILDVSKVLGASGIVDITGGAAADTIIGGKSIDTINGGSGDDIITGGSGADVITVSLGNDTITDWGVGVDTLAISAGATATYPVVKAGGVVDFGSGTTVTGNAGTLIVDATLSKAVTVTGTSGADSITGGGSADVITAGVGVDTLDGGAGNDTFNYVLTTDLFASSAIVDSVVGGDGVDTIQIGAATGGFIIANTVSWSRVSDVEVIKSVTDSGAVSVTLGASAAVAGITKVDLSLGTAATGNVIDVSAFTASTDTTLIGPTTSGKAANITGGDGIDKIIAAAGGGTIDGGLGLDIITLGAGADVVVLGTTEASADSIVGFTGGASADIIQLGGSTAANGVTVANIANLLTVTQVTAVAQVSTVTLAGAGAGDTITINGIGGTAAAVAYTTDNDTTIAALVTEITARTGETVTASATGTVGSKVLTLTANTAGTAFTATTTVVDGAGGAPAITASVATTTPNVVAVAAFTATANAIVFDTAAHLGDAGVNIGDQDSVTTIPHYAVASDTGAIYFDFDGNWTTGSVQIGTIGVVSGLTAAANFTVL